MEINFESHSDWVVATSLLVSCVKEKSLFDYLVPLLFDANKSLKKIPLGEIKLTNADLATIFNNNSILWNKLEEDLSNKKLESLVNDFHDIGTVVKHLSNIKTIN